MISPGISVTRETAFLDLCFLYLFIVHLPSNIHLSNHNIQEKVSVGGVAVFQLNPTGADSEISLSSNISLKGNPIGEYAELCYPQNLDLNQIIAIALEIKANITFN